MARVRPGIPTSLGAFCIADYKYGSSPKLWGFPNYELNALSPIDFKGGSEEDRTRKWHYKKPNKYQFGQYYQSNHYGGHHHANQLSIFSKPPTPSTKKPFEIKRIISAFHITVDEKCNRVFFMDNGRLQYYQNTTYPIQKPALWIIDLPANGCESRNFQINRRAELPDRITARGSNGFMTVTPDYQAGDSCEDLFLYITNAFYSYLTVYDYRKDKFWAFDHETFHAVEAESYLIFDKTLHYYFPLGLFNLALGYPDANGDRTAYYAPMGGTGQFAVSTKILKDSRKSPQNFNQDDFRIVGYRGCDHQVVTMAIDYTYGVMFFTEIQSYQVRCWNINQPLNPDNIHVVYESKKMLFGLMLQIDSRGYLWFHTDHIPVDYTTDYPLDLNEVNSRIFRVKVSDAIQGTACEGRDSYRIHDLYNDYEH
ncbi:L-dopachrome tautomerase yellow-f2-like [Lutzomyia longipalpis]|uniref:L-dopachrome tautomerase yellow-f2-like n=1 Tax=Lutzomyia longipalpis TaxID=7200 RepID=UPI002483D8E0|nr:L-dopachrome tautomerase yellow-f2-like [Lutzomyia longipalpis]